MSLASPRLASSRLVGVPFPTVVEAVRALCAVQSQDYLGAAWGVGQRVAGCTAGDVEAALAGGGVLRTHVLRPTWHLVLADDIRWLLDLTGPRIVAASASRYRQLELDGATLRRAAGVIERELGDGRHRTRSELGGALAESGIEATGGRLAHIVMHAELTALVCSGAPRGAQHTYALVDECVPASQRLDRDDALARLATRFAAAHSPFRDVDLAWWGGITLGDARRALRASGLEREDEQWSAADAPPSVGGPTLHLLPNFDEYVVAYRDRTHVFDRDTIADRRFLRDHLSAHLVVQDGREIGRWRRPGGGRDGVTIELLDGVASPVALDAELARYTTFVTGDRRTG